MIWIFHFADQSTVYVEQCRPQLCEHRRGHGPRTCRSTRIRRSDRFAHPGNVMTIHSCPSLQCSGYVKQKCFHCFWRWKSDSLKRNNFLSSLILCRRGHAFFFFCHSKIEKELNSVLKTNLDSSCTQTTQTKFSLSWVWANEAVLLVLATDARVNKIYLHLTKANLARPCLVVTCPQSKLSRKTECVLDLQK